MFVKVLRAKLHTLTVTGKNLFYEGSLTLDENLMNAAGLYPFEAIWVYNLNNGKRFETYLIPGGKGEVFLNGAAARMGEVGDELIVVSYAWIDKSELKDFSPVIVYVKNNQISSIKNESLG